MGRKSEFESTNKNPAERFLEWSSKNKSFTYYDKEKKENVVIPLPFSFLTLAERTTVKGFDNQDETGIYSNEVKYLSEPMEVKNFAGKTIAKGEWNDISGDVSKRGGKFTKSVYAMTKKGTLINLQLFGGAIGEWFEFTKKSKKRLADEWVTVSDFEERKKMGNTFFVPVFKYNKSLTDEEAKLADDAYDLFEEFETEPSPRKKESDIYVNDAEEVSANKEVEEGDDLPF
jgi:hypothetical protein